LTVARYALAALRAVSDGGGRSGGDGRDRRQREEGKVQLTDLLIHALYLLVMAGRLFLRAARVNRLPQGKDRLLPRYLAAVAEVLWDACEWRAGRPRPTTDGSGYEGGSGGLMMGLGPGGSHHLQHQHNHVDLFGGAPGVDGMESDQRLNALRDRIDGLLAKAQHAGTEEEEQDVAAELQAVLAQFWRTKGVPAGLPHWLVNEVRARGHAIPLPTSAAALRASCSLSGILQQQQQPGPGAGDGKIPRSARELLEEMVEEGLPTLLRQLDRTATAGQGVGVGGSAARREALPMLAAS
jgi:hypothetical protein